ncbi:tyrosine-type recombinase/integrase [Candidatus Bathyarchaeota archaeon]|nr:tyrosine-type recombinase/integrase [Candidatus Bathyarchaeota archaeon]
MAGLCCPECGSNRLYKDGLRYLSDGRTAQRFLCRSCGYRFSEKRTNLTSPTVGEVERTDLPCADSAQGGIKTSFKDAESASLTLQKDVLDYESKFFKNCLTNSLSDAHQEAILMEVQRQTEKREAGATQAAQQDVKGKIVQFMFQLANDGINEATIQNYVKTLNLLIKYGADLSNPETVKEVIAKQKRWSESTKSLAVIVYGKFAQLNNIHWKPPIYKPNRKVPFIPLESELDSLIASCGKKLSALLKLLKETGIRVGEALKLQWKDLDIKTNTIILNSTEKHGVCRVIKISEELMAMLNSLPKTSDRVFGYRHLSSWEGSFSLQRRKAAVKLQNPRLLQIHFHTFRHWKATMEYAKTKDILHVMKTLGHRNLQTTLIYTQLTSFESNEYHSATARTVEEAKQLIEAGFEYVCEIDKVQLFRKRK